MTAIAQNRMYLLSFYSVSSPAQKVVVFSAPAKKQVGVSISLNKVVYSKRNDSTEYRPPGKWSENAWAC